MVSIPDPIEDWIDQFTSERGFFSSSSDVVHDDTDGGTDGNPHSQSASTNHGNDSENYTIEIDGQQIEDGDTVNFQT